MARGDTRAPARTTFDDAEDHAAASAPAAPKRLRYPCAAHQCPMPGALYLGGSSDGLCGWHAREPSGEWPLITQAIKDWECVHFAINRARRVLTDPLTCADGKTQRETLQAEWLAMLPAVQGSGWKARLEPRERETLAEWCVRLEGFLGARVKERQKGSGVVDETHPTPYVAEVRAGLRETPLKGNAADGWTA